MDSKTIILENAYDWADYHDVRKMETHVKKLTTQGARIEIDLGTTDKWFYYIRVFTRSKDSKVYKKAIELGFEVIAEP